MKWRRKLSAGLLAFSCMLLMGFTALADSDSTAEVKSVPLTKVIEKLDQAAAPNTSFTFTVEADQNLAGGNTDLNGDNPVKPGTNGAVTLEGSVSFTPALSDYNTGKLSGSTNLVFHPEVFEMVGIYRYILKETKGEYEGIHYDDTVIYLDLYVGNRSSDGKSGLMVYAVVAFTQSDLTDIDSRQKVGGANSGKDGVTFTNVMSDLTEEDSERIQNVTVNNRVSGNQADLTKKFSYTILISGNNSDASKDGRKEMYLAKGPDDEPILITSGESADFSLSHGQSLTVYGLSQSDTFQITQRDDGDGYATSVYRSSSKLSDSGDTGAQSMIWKDKFKDAEIDFVNKKSLVTPTGIAFTYGPYVLMIVFGGIVAGLYIRSRRHEDF